MLATQKCFVFSAIIGEALFLAKAPRERLTDFPGGQNALCRSGRLLEVPVAEMVNRRAQEHAFPTAKRNAAAFERPEGLLQIVVGAPTPKLAIEIWIIARQLILHRCRMVTPCGHWEMSSL